MDVIIDTDIGDDIDDAFALSLALASPDVRILGITTAWGDTALRARLVGRLLALTQRSDIPIAVGIPTQDHVTFTQAHWAQQFVASSPAQPRAVDFMLDQIRRRPGQITLVCIAPLTNVQALIARDPATFRKLKRAVIMGGSMVRGYGNYGYLPAQGPSPEYNIVQDIPAARAVLASGIPIAMLPLDATQVKLDEVRRDVLFADGTPLTDALTLLYHQWSALSPWGPTPTLFDPVAMAYTIDPALCPTTPMHIEVDDLGFTRSRPGPPNVAVCLAVHEDAFLQLLMNRLLAQHLGQ